MSGHCRDTLGKKKGYFIVNVNQLSVCARQKSFYKMSLNELCSLHFEVMVLNHWPVCFGKKPLLWDVINVPGFNWLIDGLVNCKYRKVLKIIRNRIGWLNACQWEYREIRELDIAEMEREMLKDLTDVEHRQPYCRQIPRMTIYRTGEMP